MKWLDFIKNIHIEANGGCAIFLVLCTAFMTIVGATYIIDYLYHYIINNIK